MSSQTSEQSKTAATDELADCKAALAVYKKALAVKESMLAITDSTVTVQQSAISVQATALAALENALTTCQGALENAKKALSDSMVMVPPEKSMVLTFTTHRQNSFAGVNCPLVSERMLIARDENILISTIEKLFSFDQYLMRFNKSNYNKDHNKQMCECRKRYHVWLTEVAKTLRQNGVYSMTIDRVTWTDQFGRQNVEQLSHTMVIFSLVDMHAMLSTK